MKNQSTAPNRPWLKDNHTPYRISSTMLLWLVSELDKLSKRSLREGEGTFTVIGYLDGLSYLFQSKSDSTFTPSATKLMEAAQAGERIVLTLPAQAASKSVHVGQPGEKLSLDVEITAVYTHNGAFGITFIHKIRDTEGNEFVWFSQGKRVEEGVYHMTAKVHKEPSKAHSEYYGTKQTRLTHCKFEQRRVINAGNSTAGVLPLTYEEDEDGTAPF